MSLLDKIFGRPKPNSAATAKERLQLVIAYDKGGAEDPAFLPQMKDEIMAVIKRYVNVDDSGVQVGLKREGTASMLEINIAVEADDRPA